MLHSCALCPLHPRALGPGVPTGITLLHLVKVSFVISCQRLNSAIIYDRDFSYNYFGFKVKEHVVPGLLGRVGMLLESSGLGQRGAREEVGHQWGSEDEGDLHRAAAQWDKSWSFLVVGIF